MNSIVFIRELTAYATIGVYDWEKQIKQKLLFNIEMAWDFSRAAETDDVADCLNYAEVSEKVRELAEKEPVQLVETLAYRTAQMLQQAYQLSWLKVELHKPRAVAQAESVGVVVELGKR